jgi:hypothetical protein
VEELLDDKGEDFEPPECGRNLIRLKNAVEVAVQIGNIQCASVLLRAQLNSATSYSFVERISSRQYLSQTK